MPTMMAKPQLVYFDIRGRAEPIRHLLNDNGIAYEEIICKEESWATEWKPKMQFGQLPCLKDDGLQLVQSNAILRYLGRKHGLYGNDINEKAQIDMICDSVEDIRMKYIAFIYQNYENGKDGFIASIPSQLQPFEIVLSRNGADKSGCSFGGKKSFVDYSLFDLLDTYRVLAPKCLDGFPVLDAYYKQIISRPGIVTYRASNTFKSRTINYNRKQ